ncbi:MAG: hypothetical protein V3S94_05250 [Gammaproteobacteria bacterium]
MASGFKSDRRLYLSRDKSRVLEEGEKEAGWLFATPGSQIVESTASAYGLECRDGKVILPKAPAEPKAAKRPEDKALKRGGDKAAPARPPDREKP